VNFLTDPLYGRSTHRQMDVMLYRWVCGKHTPMNYAGVSPFVGVGVETFTVGQTVLNVTSSKVAKHDKACFDNQMLLYHLYLTHLAS